MSTDDDQSADDQVVELVRGFHVGDVAGELLGLQIIAYDDLTDPQPERTHETPVYGMTADQAEDLSKHLFLTAQRIRAAAATRN